MNVINQPMNTSKLINNHKTRIFISRIKFYIKLPKKINN